MDRQTQRNHDLAISLVESLGQEIDSLETQLSELQDKYDELEEKYNDLIKD